MEVPEEARCAVYCYTVRALSNTTFLEPCLDFAVFGASRCLYCAGVDEARSPPCRWVVSGSPHHRASFMLGGTSSQDVGPSFRNCPHALNRAPSPLLGLKFSTIWIHQRVVVTDCDPIKKKTKQLFMKKPALYCDPRSDMEVREY